MKAFSKTWLVDCSVAGSYLFITWGSFSSTVEMLCRKHLFMRFYLFNCRLKLIISLLYGYCCLEKCVIVPNVIPPVGSGEGGINAALHPYLVKVEVVSEELLDQGCAVTHSSFYFLFFREGFVALSKCLRLFIRFVTSWNLAS